MSKERCKETNSNSFFGNFLYTHKVPGDHFLKRLNEIIDWDRFTRKLLKYYKGRGKKGQALYNPAIMLKMLLLSYLYNVSERQVEALENNSLSVAYFLELGANEKAPDHSTLTLFKNRLLENGGQGAYEGFFDEIIEIARERGMKFGRLQVVDSVHVVADINVVKERGNLVRGFRDERSDRRIIPIRSDNNKGVLASSKNEEEAPTNLRCLIGGYKLCAITDREIMAFMLHLQQKDVP